MSDLINVQVNSVELNKDVNLLTENDAVPKTYVDSVISNQDSLTKTYVNQKIENLISNAPGALDTLNELAEAINDDANFGLTIATNIANERNDRISSDNTLTNNLNAETDARVSADNTLTNNLNEETDARVSADDQLTAELNTEINSRIDSNNQLTAELNTETDSRISEDNQLRSELIMERDARILKDLQIDETLNTEENTRMSETSTLQATKFDKSLKYIKNYDGNLKVENTAYLYIGNNWRITTRDTETEKRLFFEYTTDGLFWSAGTPYIRSTPSLVITLDTIIPQGIPKSFNITTNIGENDNLSLVINQSNQPGYISNNYHIGNPDSIYTGFPDEKIFTLVSIEGLENEPIFKITNTVNSSFGNFWYNENNELVENPQNTFYSNIVPDKNWFSLSNIILTSSFTFKANIQLVGFNDKFLGFNDSGNFISQNSYAQSVLTNAENSLEFTFTVI